MENITDVEKAIKAFIEKRRPPENIRKKLDVSYTFENNVLEIFEIRPFLLDEKKIIYPPVAKAKYIKSSDTWKLYWQRANLKWQLYEPEKKTFYTIEAVLEEIDKNK